MVEGFKESLEEIVGSENVKELKDVQENKCGTKRTRKSNHQRNEKRARCDLRSSNESDVESSNNENDAESSKGEGDSTTKQSVEFDSTYYVMAI